MLTRERASAIGALGRAGDLAGLRAALAEAGPGPISPLALHTAVQGPHVEAVQLLLTVTDWRAAWQRAWSAAASFGQTAVMHALPDPCGRFAPKWDPLVALAKCGDLDLLQRVRPHCDYVSYANQALVVAAQNGHVEAVSFLAPYANTEGQRTAAEAAAAAHRLDIVESLLHQVLRGPQPALLYSAIVLGQDALVARLLPHCRPTPSLLLAAVRGGNQVLLERLLRDVDPSANDSEALRLAVRLEDPDATRALLPRSNCFVPPRGDTSERSAIQLALRSVPMLKVFADDLGEAAITIWEGLLATEQARGDHPDAVAFCASWRAARAVDNALVASEVAP